MAARPNQLTHDGTELFRPKVLSFNLPAGADPRMAAFSLSSKENESLALAARERFDLLAGPIRWGSEDETEFGELLRSLVVTFLPRTAFHLNLLRNVASCQWQLQRADRIKCNVFEAGKDTIGTHMLPAGTTDAFEFQELSSNLLRDLQRAIAIYVAARK